MLDKNPTNRPSASEILKNEYIAKHSAVSKQCVNFMCSIIFTGITVKDEAYVDVQFAALYWKASCFRNFPLLGIMPFLCLLLRNFVIHC